MIFVQSFLVLSKVEGSKHDFSFFSTLLERKIEHVYTMSRNRVKLRLFGRVERLAIIPGVFDGRNDPEVAFGIAHNPLPGGLVHK